MQPEGRIQKRKFLQTPQYGERPLGRLSVKIAVLNPHPPHTPKPRHRCNNSQQMTCAVRLMRDTIFNTASTLTDYMLYLFVSVYQAGYLT
ncbi:hypothetical protein J6590_078785 [Homalodisca vitripennis]|nr:hypothetical protein J6590_078785 [Homalodisca vitripennis]